MFQAPSIRWLHLSDLHAGCAGIALRNELFDELSAEIRGMAEEIGPLDLILFTGDLAYSGAEDDYDEVVDVHKRILGWLRAVHPGAPAPLLFAVPGNHDLLWPSGSLRRECRILRDYEDGDDDDIRELRKQLWTRKDPDLLAPLFKAYSAWQQEHVIKPLEQAQRQGDRCKLIHASFFPGDLSTIIEKGGFTLSLVGLNSSWLQYMGGNFEGRLHIPIEQFQAALPVDVPGDFFDGSDAAFLLMHHPPSWLSPAARGVFDGAIYKPERFDLCLFGHMHEARAETLSRAGGKPRHFFQAPSLFGLEGYGTSHENRAFGYAWGEIHASGGIRIWPRKLSKKGDGTARFERDPHFHYEGMRDWLWVRKPNQSNPSGSPLKKIRNEPGSWAMDTLFEMFDADLQDAFSLAYNASRRSGSNRISTRSLFAAILRLRPELASVLPIGSLPAALDESIPAEQPPLTVQPRLSSCVADSIAHLSMARPPERKIGPLDMFVDVARYGNGPSVRQLRVHGVGRAEIDELVRRRGWQVVRRKP